MNRNVARPGRDPGRPLVGGVDVVAGTVDVDAVFAAAIQRELDAGQSTAALVATRAAVASLLSDVEITLKLGVPTTGLRASFARFGGGA